jgi:hypothetical protein
LDEPARVELRGVSKTYGKGGRPDEALRDASLPAAPGWRKPGPGVNFAGVSRLTIGLWIWWFLIVIEHGAGDPR